MFQELLSVTQGLNKLLQKETSELAEAVCDTLRGKHTDAFATDLYERTKAMCYTHTNTVYQNHMLRKCIIRRKWRILCWRQPWVQVPS